MKDKFDQMELKLKNVEKHQETLVNHYQLDSASKLIKDDLNEKSNILMNKITDRLAFVEKNKMDILECNTKLAGFAPMKALDKYNQTIQEIKNEIERNIERKFNDEISTLKFKIENSMKEDDVHTLLETYATKEDLQRAEIDFDQFDFALKGKKLKKFIDKCIEDFDEEDQEMGSDDLSSDYESELEDD